MDARARNAPPTVSVIIPCLNGARTLAGQLDALVCQQLDEQWEVVLADNGSIDGSRELAQSYRDRLALRVVDASDRRGSGHARNVGVSAARSDRLLFCDVDDVVAAGWLPAMARALAAHESVASRVDDLTLNPPWLQAMWDNTRDATPGMVTILDFMLAASGCGFGITRRVYRAVGPFDETLKRLDDIDYSWRVQLAGWPIHYVDDAVIHYRYRPSMRDIWWQCLREGEAEVRLYKKYRELGLRWRPPGRAMREWIGLMRGLPGLRKPLGRRHWIKTAGGLSGRLKGSVGERIMAL